MSYTLTLAQIRTAAQRRSDMVNSQFVSTAEWTEIINRNLGRFYDILTETHPHEFYEGTSSITTTSGVSTYSLPSDFYRILMVEYISGNYRFPVEPFNRYTRPFLTRYAVPAGRQFTVYYVPRMTVLANDSDTFDFIQPGWDDYVIAGSAADALQKEESDNGPQRAVQEEARQRIVKLSNKRNDGLPDVIPNVSRRNFSYAPMMPQEAPAYMLRGNQIEILFADFYGAL